MTQLLPIVKPPFSKLGKRLESLTRKALYDFKMLDNSEPLGIALSGGKDSLSLLYLLHAINGRGFHKKSISAFHVQGAFSCGSGIDPKFLKAICDNLNISFTCLDVQQSLDTLQCYSCSRKRRSLIFEAAKKQGIRTVAFGHHRDDSIQTLLLNLFHKAEFAANLGLINMIEYDITIIRPLIYVAEKDIINFAKSHGFMRNCCKCPVGQNSKRKKIEQLIEHIEQFFPNVRSNLSQASFQYGSDKAKKL